MTDEETNANILWTQAWWLDSNHFDGLLCGAWNVFARSPQTLACFDNKPWRTPTITLDDKCKEMGRQLLPDPRGVVRHVAIENSSGMITTVQTPEGMPRLSIVSKLGPISFHEARKAGYQWHLIRADYRHLAIEERIVMIGGVTEWCVGRPCAPADCVDARRGVYPKGFLEHALPEMMGQIIRPLSDILCPDHDSASADRASASSSQVTGSSNRLRCDWSCADNVHPSFRTGGIEPRKILDGLVNGAL